jgi:adenylate cyclase
MAWFISVAVITAYMSNRERLERTSLMQLFSKHVSREVAEVIWKERDQFLDGGRPRSQKLISTVMFTDLEGFTALSEKMEPRTLIDWLNTYLETMAQLVIKHGGIVDDYAGDGLKADFGVPLARTTEAEISQDAVNAVNCALAMEKEMKRLNTLWEESNLPTVRMRVGIFTGPVVAGSLGSSQRLKYTTIGDTVNIASRLERFAKDLVGYDFTNSSCRILIGESTLRYLGNQFVTEKVGEVSLKGKVEKITTYCLMGRTDECSDMNHKEEMS